MRYLFIHQNFPGQFRHVAKALADDPANQVVGVGETKNLSGRAPLHPNIRVLSYQANFQGIGNTHRYVRGLDAHIRRGQSIARLLLALRDQKKFNPDFVIGHPGWGECLFLKDLFPCARHVQYFEYYYQGTHGDLGFDPAFPVTLDDQFAVRIKNSTQLHSLVACDQGISPTEWQRSRYPDAFQSQIDVIHEGIDTELVRPEPGAWVDIDGIRIQAGDEVVTYVARNLEPHRGFHVFMRMLPRLQALRPNARILIVGGDDVSYGQRLPKGQTYRQRYCKEIREQVDWSRIHFLGKVPYIDYLRVLQVSAVHVYLTYPFVLSWSMLEAMAAGCVLVASDTSPVQEVVVDGVNGVLVNFFETEQMAKAIADVLFEPSRHIEMRQQARDTIVKKYDLKTICLPKLMKLLSGVNANPII